MIKSELIVALTRKMSHVLSGQKVADGVNGMIKMMVGAFSTDHRIEIRGFGSFHNITRKAKVARNPKTGENVMTENKKVVRFKPGKGLRDRVNESRAKCPIIDD
jgi:integration host factor subunit beta